jgi:hypothetical protein
MSAVVSIVAKVMIYLVEVVVWLFIVKIAEKSFRSMKKISLPRLRPIKA